MENFNDQDQPNECANNVEDEVAEQNAYAPEMNDQTLFKLQHNDPALTSVCANWKGGSYVNGVDWKEKGGLIGNNTNLKTLKLDIEESSRDLDGYRLEGSTDENFEAFCIGFAGNRSIERLYITYWNCPTTYSTMLVEMLSTFLERNTNLSQLVMDGCEMDSGTAGVLTSILFDRTNKISLRCLELAYCSMGDHKSVGLIGSLSNHCNLMRLSLAGNRIGFNGCVALVKLLKKRSSKLQDLHLEDSDIDDNCVAVLTGGLNQNSTLKKLSLSENSEITANGWQIFSAVLRGPSSTLETLYLAETSLCDDGVDAIACALATNTNLKILDLSFNESITTNGWRSFFGTLKNSASSALEEVSLSANEIDDEAAGAMANAFMNFARLKTLRLDGNHSIELAGWQAISCLISSRSESLVELDLSSNVIQDAAAVAVSSSLANSLSLRILNLGSLRRIGTAGWEAFSTCFRALALEKLDLNSNRVNDEGAISWANTLVNMRTLKGLDLHYLHSVTPAGWRAILAILSNPCNPNSTLEELYLGINGIDDEGAVAFADALISNNKLKALDLHTNRHITGAAWQAFSRLVCDPASIMATYSSNHTLHQLCDGDSADTAEDDPDNIPLAMLPTDLKHSLELNRDQNKTEVARQKILWSHFQGGNDNGIQALCCMDLNVMPHAIVWIGRDYKGRSFLHQAVRTIPSLVEHANKKLATKSHQEKSHQQFALSKCI